MSASTVTRLVIVGGGTAGWMSAAFLSSLFPARQLSLTVVESAEIGTIGVGEATIPPIQVFNKAAGIDEAAFLRATEGTYKLGIEFVDWLRPGHRYMHPFGQPGQAINGASFHAWWLRLRAAGYPHPLSDFWMSEVLARKNRFDFPSSDPRTPKSNLAYAYHFDAGLYAQFLRRIAESRGVRRIEATVANVALDGADGTVSHLDLADGRRVEGDFFIDCTGFRALLIGQALGQGYEDWSHYLPANRAVAVPSQRVAAPVPYTSATARTAGWQWRINLRHRTGNGYVYVSDLISDDEAAATLLANLDAPALDDPRFLRFTTGRRRSRHKNVLAVGLSSGFLEPLESTSIHFIQHALIKFAATFPLAKDDPVSAGIFNRIMAEELEQVRDFLVFHYHANDRVGEPLWDRARAMPLPDSLVEKMALFRARGFAIFPSQTLFQEPNWLAVMLGQGLEPQSYDPLTDGAPLEEVRGGFDAMRRTIAQVADGCHPHEAFLDDGAAVPMARARA
ncbi:tryptophan halogenase family protein [Nitrospirillum pindoramense]|uniref:Tryptophan halogenase n=1 Tax=Nitrospirillum amazonense TaxID=28077 RepID=A0A560HKY2_9PROT|nr:tryptophan halogenase family protein [Nitrospirillum amazonense]TWB45994.1 tryptophan halogenase [Nitrospirillum amazonense]